MGVPIQKMLIYAIAPFLFLFEEKVSVGGGTRFLTAFGTSLPPNDGKGDINIIHY